MSGTKYYSDRFGAFGMEIEDRFPDGMVESFLERTKRFAPDLREIDVDEYRRLIADAEEVGEALPGVVTWSRRLTPEEVEKHSEYLDREIKRLSDEVRRRVSNAEARP